MPPADPALGRKLGHFRLLERLGAGGMGVVYRAEDDRLRRHVAIKLLPSAATDDPDRRARLLREARSAAAVVHPSIAAIHAIEEDPDGTVYLVMELVPGESLRARLARETSLAEDEVVRIATDLARGLARAHEAGIVHRDLKPENVMLGRDGEVKILDFGLAKSFAAPEGPSQGAPTVQTREGGMIGTPEYMAPEQARGVREVDARADVFALGVMMFEMVEGRRPFVGQTALGTIAAILTDDPPPLRQASAWLSALVLRCLAKEASARPTSGGEILALLRARTPLPALATPSSDLAFARTLTPDDASAKGLAASTSTSARRAPSATAGRLVWPALALSALTALAFLLVRTTTPSPDGRTDPAPDGADVDASRSGAEVPLLRTTRLDVPADEAVTEAGISPDGTRVALVVGTGLVVLDVQSGAPIPAPVPAGAVVLSASFFPDGVRLLACLAADGRASLYELGPSSPPVLFREGACYGAPSPDGSTVAFHDGSAWVVAPAHGGSAQVLLTAGDATTVPHWSPDGSAVLVAGSSNNEYRLWLAQIDASGVRTLLRGVHSSRAGAVFADATTLLYFGIVPGILGSELCRMRLDGSDPGPCLARIPRTEIAAAAIDASGRRMVVVGASSRAEVRVLSTEDRSIDAARTATPTDGNHRVHAWLDDSTLLVTAAREGHWQLLAQPLEGPSHVLAAAAPLDLTVPTRPPDGRGLLAFAVGGSPDASGAERVRLVRVVDGAIAETLREVTPEHPSPLGRPPPLLTHLTCNEARCVLLETDGGDVRVTDALTGEDVTRIPADQAGFFRAGSLSRDGHELLVCRGEELVGIALARGAPAERAIAHLPACGYVAEDAAGTLWVTSVFTTTCHVWRVDPHGTVEEIAATPREFWLSPTPSPDLRHVAFVVRDLGRSVGIVELTDL